jgi:crossover junction endodeoxyribonuclease RuvC
MIILGIDPGLATIGYGVIKTSLRSRSLPFSESRIKGKIECLEYGVIKTDASSEKGERLKIISLGTYRLLKKYTPHYLALETLYFFKNMKTALPVSEARGAILLTAARKSVKIEEYTPLQVKMKICGYGRAEKKEIQKTMKKILKLKEIPRPDDASDALAIAIASLGN